MSSSVNTASSSCAWSWISATRDCKQVAHVNEPWEFDDEGYMRRDESINNYEIDESERKFRWER